MAESRFTPENRAAVVASVEAGASLADASRAADVRPSTVKGWITRGRKGEDGYREFVAEVEAARRACAERLPPMDREEFQRRLDAAVRGGSVVAMKLWADLDRERREPATPKQPRSRIASLAERRRAREAV